MSKRRIVLSDDEDQDQDQDRYEYEGNNTSNVASLQTNTKEIDDVQYGNANRPTSKWNKQTTLVEEVHDSDEEVDFESSWAAVADVTVGLKKTKMKVDNNDNRNSTSNGIHTRDTSHERRSSRSSARLSDSKPSMVINASTSTIHRCSLQRLPFSTTSRIKSNNNHNINHSERETEDEGDEEDEEDDEENIGVSKYPRQRIQESSSSKKQNQQNGKKNEESRSPVAMTTPVAKMFSVKKMFSDYQTSRVTTNNTANRNSNSNRKKNSDCNSSSSSRRKRMSQLDYYEEKNYKLSRSCDDYSYNNYSDDDDNGFIVDDDFIELLDDDDDDDDNDEEDSDCAGVNDTLSYDQKKTKRRKNTRIIATDDRHKSKEEEDDDELIVKNSNRNSNNKSSKKRSRTIIALSDDDNDSNNNNNNNNKDDNMIDVDDYEDQERFSLSMVHGRRKRSNKRIVLIDSSSEDNQSIKNGKSNDDGESCEEEESNEDEEEEEEDEDEQTMYLRIDAMLDKAEDEAIEEVMLSKTRRESRGSLTSERKNTQKRNQNRNNYDETEDRLEAIQMDSDSDSYDSSVGGSTKGTDNRRRSGDGGRLGTFSDYIELLGRILLDPFFWSSLYSSHTRLSSLSSSARSHSPGEWLSLRLRFEKAVRQVEGLICTSRESLLGSGAWGNTQGFVDELQSRPFYKSYSTKGCEDVRCAACNRLGKVNEPQNREVYLFGSRYDAKSVWSGNQNWDKHLPADLFMYPWRGQGLKEQEQKQSSLDNDSSEDDSDGEYSDNSSEDASDAVVFGDPYRVHALPPFMHSWAPGLTSIKRQSVWFLSSHCCRRTKLYHTLLHYKLRLLLKVQDQLRRGEYDLEAMVGDRGFVAGEYKRYNALISQVNNIYNNAAVQDHQINTWND